ncbi:Uncharacterised protein [Mycobacteroides abscessus subsp. abscessus]|nr:Uncharacterised protein [Mycobacteroides abscessus subsp. abscessus]
MKPPMSIVDINVGRSILHGLDGRAHWRKLNVGIGQRQCRLDRISLEELAKFEELQDVSRCPLCHPGSAARLVFYEALLG